MQRLKTRISRRIEWDMGHRIPDHESLCRHPHGHRYVAEVTIIGPVDDTPGSPKRGMVMDFGGLKKVLSFIPDQYDHSFMVYELDPFAKCLEKFDKEIYDGKGAGMRVHYMPFIPTAEKIAEFVFDHVKMRGVDVVEVTVWETPNCKATVTK